MNAVYGLPRFEIESVHALRFLSGTHIFSTMPTMLTTVMMISSWSWHCQIITCHDKACLSARNISEHDLVCVFYGSAHGLDESFMSKIERPKLIVGVLWISRRHIHSGLDKTTKHGICRQCRWRALFTLVDCNDYWKAFLYIGPVLFIPPTGWVGFVVIEFSLDRGPALEWVSPLKGREGAAE